MSFLWDPWYPCFGFLVTYPLGIKTRGGSLIHALQRWYMLHIPWDLPLVWRDTCQPLGSQHGSWADLFHVPVSMHWWGSKSGPIVPQMNVILTEPVWLSLYFEWKPKLKMVLVYLVLTKQCMEKVFLISNYIVSNGLFKDTFQIFLQLMVPLMSNQCSK